MCIIRRFFDWAGGGISSDTHAIYTCLYFRFIGALLFHYSTLENSCKSRAKCVFGVRLSNNIYYEHVWIRIYEPQRTNNVGNSQTFEVRRAPVRLIIVQWNSSLNSIHIPNTQKTYSKRVCEQHVEEQTQFRNCYPRRAYARVDALVQYVENACVRRRCTICRLLGNGNAEKSHLYRVWTHVFHTTITFHSSMLAICLFHSLALLYFSLLFATCC